MNTKLEEQSRKHEVEVPGQFTMLIYTRARAMADRIPMHDLAAFVAELRPDDLPTCLVNYESLENLRDFMYRVWPRSHTLLCAESEDHAAILASLEWDVGVTLH
jgi:hypothetical protein